MTNTDQARADEQTLVADLHDASGKDDCTCGVADGSQNPIEHDQFCAFRLMQESAVAITRLRAERDAAVQRTEAAERLLSNDEMFERACLSAIHISQLNDELAAERAARDRVRTALEHAIKIIEEHVPEDALGRNAQGDRDVGFQTWPIRDEYLHNMRQALSAPAEASAGEAGRAARKGMAEQGEE